MTAVLAIALAFVSAASAVAGLLLLLSFASVPWRAGAGGSGDNGAPARFPRAIRVLVALGTRLRPRRAGTPADLGARLAAAGEPAGFGVRELMAAKVGAALAAGIAGTLLASVAPGRLGFAIVLAAPVAGFLVPDLWLARRAAERARRVRRELPALLDLLRVTVESGASLGAALRAVG